MFEKIKNKWADIRYSSMFPWIVALTILGVLSVGLFALDRSIPKNKNKIVEVVSEIKPSLAKNFDNAVNLEKVSASPAIFGSLISDSKGQYVFVNKDLKLMTSTGVIQSQDKFLPDGMQMISDDKVLINQSNNSYIVNLKDGKTEILPDSMSWLNQLSNGDFVFIQKRDNGIAIKTSKGLDFTNPDTIGSLEFSQFKPDKLEIRVFNEQPFLLNTVYKDNKLENTKIYSITNKLAKVAEVNNIAYQSIGTNQMLISTKDGEAIDNKIVSFEFGQAPKIVDYNFRLEVGQEGVQGGVSADRCAIYPDGINLVCLVKRNYTAGSGDYLESDAIIEYNTKSKLAKILYPNLAISAHSIHIINDQIHIFGQENNLIYKIK